MKVVNSNNFYFQNPLSAIFYFEVSQLLVCVVTTFVWLKKGEEELPEGSNLGVYV